MPAGLVQTYRAFAHNNAWANHRLLTACAALPQAGFEAERIGFFPSLQRTLNHIHVIDLFYVDALEGGWLGPAAWKNEVPYPALAALKPAQAAVDKRLIAVCDALTPESLDSVVRINRDPAVQTERCDRLLMHLFQHQIHHRGQAHAMLSGTSVTPPQLDEFFAEGEASLRATEFADLGWTEDTVWNSSSLAR
ncbi:DinB family protein [Bradyrhizobium sp. 1(2017)]|uniref:DinB family protein n=1 Tax=Bradyrhizobium sp. 1(2017) TaxID=1404888 RepID=UPI00140F375B|nr:DinB family protein [Bradyrhizobium sp. 1(2017)]QIO33873.1 damage-inducible protein DinB [Bradyrhizobium sp. 1(2017)]